MIQHWTDELSSICPWKISNCLLISGRLLPNFTCDAWAEHQPYHHDEFCSFSSLLLPTITDSVDESTFLEHMLNCWSTVEEQIQTGCKTFFRCDMFLLSLSLSIRGTLTSWVLIKHSYTLYNLNIQLYERSSNSEWSSSMETIHLFTSIHPGVTYKLSFATMRSIPMADTIQLLKSRIERIKNVI